MSMCDDRRLYFNDHHNLEDNVTFKRTRCKRGLFWVENSHHQRGVYLHNFTFYFDVHLIRFPYLLNKSFFYGPSSLEGKQTMYSHLSREGGFSIHLNIVKLKKLEKRKTGSPREMIDVLTLMIITT